MVAANAGAIQTERIDLGRLWWASLLAGLGATVANAVVYFIAAAAGAIPQTVLVPTINNQPAPLTILLVMINSFVPALVAGVLLALLNRFVRRQVRVFRIIAAVVPLVSCAKHHP